MRDQLRLPGLPVAAALLLALAVVDLGVLNPRSPTGWVLLAEAVLLAGAAWSADRQARAGRTAALVAAGLSAAAVSAAVTWFVHETVPQRAPGWAALGGLLLVVVALCRWLPVPALPVVLAPLTAVVLLELRLPPDVSSNWAPDAYGWLALLGVAAVAWGFGRRAEDRHRLDAQERVRRIERLELARDLHDDVAHHVTAMVVLAQAGEQLAERDPAQARRLFADLERTGQDGLVAMSRMVRLLRDDTRPAHPLDSVATLVERFGAELHVGDGVDERRWSPEVARSVQRLVQEGLTNVRKHARTATSVRVSIDQDDDGLLVRVRDDGTGRGRARFRSSGFGLLGLSERVAALGGELHGGPVDGGGWQLTASLPEPR